MRHNSCMQASALSASTMLCVLGWQGNDL